jgi:hypothetical protein
MGGFSVVHQKKHAIRIFFTGRITCLTWEPGAKDWPPLIKQNFTEAFTALKTIISDQNLIPIFPI